MQRTPSRSRSGIRARIVVLLVGTLFFFVLLQGGYQYSLIRNQERTAARAALEASRAALENARSAAVNFNEQVERISGLAHSIGMALSMPDWGTSGIQAILDRIIGEYPSVYSLSWVGADGLALASSLPGTAGSDLSGSEWFGTISAGRDRFLSNILDSSVAGEPTICLARGIRDEKGKLLGVVLVSVLPDELGRIPVAEKTGGAAVAILDRTGRAVAWLSDRKPAPGELEKLAERPEVMRGLRGEEAVGTFDSGENKGILAVTPVPSSGFLACSIRERTEISGLIGKEILDHAVMLFIFAAAIAIFAYGVFRAVAAPVVELRNRIASLTEGRKNQALLVAGPPEIEDLTGAFNRLAEEIHAREVERFSHLGRLRELAGVSAGLLGETDVQGLLQKIVDASRVLTDANFSVAGLMKNDILAVGAAAGSVEFTPRASDEPFRFSREGPHREVIESGLPIRYTDAELRRHPAWNEFVKARGIARGILGVPLKDAEGHTLGLIMTTGKREGEFTPEDEAVLTQLAAMASLGLQLVIERGGSAGALSGADNTSL